MNPAAVALLESLAQTGITIYMQSKGKDAAALQGIIPMVTVISNAFTQTGATLKQAQDEGWTDDDIRWVPVFAAGDAVLDALERRMT